MWFVRALIAFDPTVKKKKKKKVVLDDEAEGAADGAAEAVGDMSRK